jgi:hypothetical protein
LNSVGTIALGNFSTADFPERAQSSPTAAVVLVQGHRFQFPGSFAGDQTRHASNSILMITDEGEGHWFKWTLHSRMANEIELEV